MNYIKLVKAIHIFEQYSDHHDNINNLQKITTHNIDFT